MFRGMHSDGLYSKEDAAPAAAPGLSVSTLRHANQDSPWVGILSVVSRPALAFLQKYLPGRSRTSTTPSGVSGWQDGDVKRPFKGKNAFLDQLDDFIPEAEHHLAYHLHYQSGTNSFGPASTEALSWLSPGSLQELGIHDNIDMDLNMRREASAVGYFASAKNFLSQILLNAVSGQDVTVQNPGHQRGLDREHWPSDSVASRVKSNGWWDGIWGSADGSHGWMSGFSWRPCSMASDHHCPENDSGMHCQQAESGTAAGVAKPTELFEQRDYGARIHSESPGPCSNKIGPENYSPQSARPESLRSFEKPLLVPQPVCDHLPSIRAAAACSEVAVLTPDQDNGYSSLEEEHSNSRMHLVEPFCPELACSEPGEGAEEPVFPAEGGTTGGAGTEQPDADAASVEGEGEEVSDDSDPSDLSDTEGAEPEGPAPPLPVPSCQNKAIAYIMGGPCSEDSESDLEEDGDWDSEDDDGFDSEGSSDFSDSEDLDDEEEEEEEGEEGKESDAEEADGEVERLWNSLCRSGDPFDPRNFTASLQTAPKPAGTADEALGDGHAPAEGPPSPRPLLLGEESGEEASEVDEGESQRLWNSFSCVSDPYSPFHFQGPLRTRGAARGPRKKPPILPPPCSEQDAQDRMDSGFSEAVSTQDQPAACCTTVKKVRFVEEVEEFYASGDEDRRGPWEEFARDRCRFGRRVQETELSIGYCLAPGFRLAVFHRLFHSC